MFQTCLIVAGKRQFNSAFVFRTAISSSTVTGTFQYWISRVVRITARDKRWWSDDELKHGFLQETDNYYHGDVFRLNITIYAEQVQLPGGSCFNWSLTWLGQLMINSLKRIKWSLLKLQGKIFVALKATAISRIVCQNTYVVSKIDK